MSAIVDATKGKIQKYLTDEFGHIEIDRDGDYTFPYGSTRVFVHVAEWSESAVVTVWAPVLYGLSPTPALHEYVAESGFVFGALLLHEASDGGRNLLFSHRLLGDFLDADELMVAIVAVATTADDLDDELQPRFGGRKFGDD